MPRVKRGAQRPKKRKKVLKHTKGFKWRRKNVYKIAKDAMHHSLSNMYVGRKLKKRDMRRLWQIKINAAARKEGVSYNRFIHGLKQNKIELDRKILAELAEHEPGTFAKVAEKIK